MRRPADVLDQQAFRRSLMNLTRGMGKLIAWRGLFKRRNENPCFLCKTDELDSRSLACNHLSTSDCLEGVTRAPNEWYALMSNQAKFYLSHSKVLLRKTVLVFFENDTFGSATNGGDSWSYSTADVQSLHPPQLNVFYIEARLITCEQHQCAVPCRSWDNAYSKKAFSDSPVFARYLSAFSTGSLRIEIK